MTGLFLMYLKMGMNASILITIIILIRMCFQKAPRWFYLCLWSMCGISLLLPFRFENQFSMIPHTERKRGR